MDIETSNLSLKDILRVLKKLTELRNSRKHLTKVLGVKELPYLKLLDPYINESTIKKFVYEVMSDESDIDRVDLSDFALWCNKYRPTFKLLVLRELSKLLSERENKNQEDIELLKRAHSVASECVDKFKTVGCFPESCETLVITEMIIKNLPRLTASNLDAVFSDIAMAPARRILHKAMSIKDDTSESILKCYERVLTKKLSDSTNIKPSNFDAIYQLYNSQFNMIKDDFASSYAMKVELNRAFERLDRENPDKAADALSRYFSTKLSIDSQVDPDDQDLNALMTLFKHLSAKDTFMKLYNQRLIKRLAIEKSQGNEREKDMIEKFKEFAGDFFINPTETLLSQFEKSKSVMNTFEAHFRRKFKGALEVDLQTIKIFVFPSHIWPFPKFLSIEEYLPNDVNHCLPS